MALVPDEREHRNLLVSKKSQTQFSIFRK